MSLFSDCKTRDRGRWFWIYLEEDWYWQGDTHSVGKQVHVQAEVWWTVRLLLECATIPVVTYLPEIQAWLWNVWIQHQHCPDTWWTSTIGTGHLTPGYHELHTTGCLIITDRCSDYRVSLHNWWLQGVCYTVLLAQSCTCKVLQPTTTNLVFII